MKTFNGMDELQSAVGTHVGYSSWHTVTQEQINAFAEVTGDHQWIHTDPERAAAGPFGATVAHGYFTLSLVPMFLGEVYDLQGVSVGINYGANRVRFPAPVPVNSRIRAGFEILSLDPAAMGSRLTVGMAVELEGRDKPVCVAELMSIIVP